MLIVFEMPHLTRSSQHEICPDPVLPAESCFRCGEPFQHRSKKNYTVSVDTGDERGNVHCHKKCRDAIYLERHNAKKEKEKVAAALSQGPVGGRTRNSNGLQKLRNGLRRVSEFIISPKKSTAQREPESPIAEVAKGRNVRTRSQLRAAADECDSLQLTPSKTSSGAAVPAMETSPSEPAARRRRVRGPDDSPTSMPQRRNFLHAIPATMKRARAALANNYANLRKTHRRSKDKEEEQNSRIAALQHRIEELQREKADALMGREEGASMDNEEGASDDSETMDVTFDEAHSALTRAGYPDLLPNLLNAVVHGSISPSDQPSLFWDLLDDSARNLLVNMGMHMRWCDSVKNWCSSIFLSVSGTSAYEEVRGPAGKGYGDFCIKASDSCYNLLLPGEGAVREWAAKGAPDSDFVSGISERNISAFCTELCRSELHGKADGGQTLAVHQFDLGE